MSYDRGDYRHKWRIERTAATIRSNLGLNQFEVLTTDLLCEAVPAHLFVPRDFVAAGDARRLARLPWDGFSFTLPGEKTLMIVLNDGRPRARQTATVMEELSHHLLGHRPSAIWKDTQTGLPRRDYNHGQEAEAYDLGAALLLPKERIQRAVANREIAGDLAAVHGCSTVLVEYRIKRLRLWSRYSGYAA